MDLANEQTGVKTWRHLAMTIWSIGDCHGKMMIIAPAPVALEKRNQSLTDAGKDFVEIDFCIWVSSAKDGKATDTGDDFDWET